MAYTFIKGVGHSFSIYSFMAYIFLREIREGWEQ